MREWRDGEKRSRSVAPDVKPFGRCSSAIATVLLPVAAVLLRWHVEEARGDGRGWEGVWAGQMGVRRWRWRWDSQRLLVPREQLACVPVNKGWDEDRWRCLRTECAGRCVW